MEDSIDLNDHEEPIQTYVEDSEDEDELPELIPLGMPDFDFSFQQDLRSNDLDLSGTPIACSGLEDVPEWDGISEVEGQECIETDRTLPSVDETNSLCIERSEWNLLVNHGFETFKARDASLTLPWEQPMMQGIFHSGSNLKLPQVHGVAIENVLFEKTSNKLPGISGEIEECGGAAYAKAVSDVKDLDYFENK